VQDFSRGGERRGPDVYVKPSSSVDGEGRKGGEVLSADGAETGGVETVEEVFVGGLGDGGV